MKRENTIDITGFKATFGYLRPLDARAEMFSGVDRTNGRELGCPPIRK